MNEKEKNEYLLNKNDKYCNCCSWLPYYYLKSENENLHIIKRILRELGKKIYFGKVSLPYSDYLKLQRVIKDENL